MKKIRHRSPSAKRLRQGHLKRQYKRQAQNDRLRFPSDPQTAIRFHLFASPANIRAYSRYKGWHIQKSWYRERLDEVRRLRIEQNQKSLIP